MCRDLICAVPLATSAALSRAEAVVIFLKPRNVITTEAFLTRGWGDFISQSNFAKHVRLESLCDIIR